MTRTQSVEASAIFLLDRDEREVMSKGIAMRRSFTVRDASLTVRMAFWEIAAAKQWKDGYR